MAEAKDYMDEENGHSTERYVSINEMLVENDWDYIITQQASHDSGIEGIEVIKQCISESIQL